MFDSTSTALEHSWIKFLLVSVTFHRIGGGISGVNAAKILHQANCSFILFEARSFLGGRLQTLVTPDGDLLHQGANWIHGTGQNPLWLLNQQQHLVRTQWLPQSYYVRTRSGAVQTIVGNDSVVPGAELRDDFAAFFYDHAHVKNYIGGVADGSYSTPDLPSTWFTSQYISARNLTALEQDDLYLFEMAYQTMDGAVDTSQQGFSALLNNKFYGNDNEGTFRSLLFIFIFYFVV